MQEIVNLLNVVYADVQCVSGAVSKSNRSRGRDEAFTDGSVRYINPKLLRPFAKARQAATRLCRQYGTRFLNGWAVPDESLDLVRQGLAAISAEVASEKATFMAGLRSRLLEWETAHPEVSGYKAKFPTPTEIDSSITMLVSIYKIAPMQVGHKDLQDGISAEVQGLAGRVLSEVAQDVRDSWSPDAQAATSRSRGVLERVIRKLESLSFVDNELTTVASMINGVLDVLPSSGPIRGKDFIILSGLMNTLSDPDQVVRTARMAAQQSPDSLWVSYGVGTTAHEAKQEAAKEEEQGFMGFAVEAPVEPAPVKAATTAVTASMHEPAAPVPAPPSTGDLDTEEDPIQPAAMPPAPFAQEATEASWSW